jgi:hypothetical protein
VKGVFRAGQSQKKDGKSHDFPAFVHQCTRCRLKVLSQAFNAPGNAGSSRESTKWPWKFSSRGSKLAVQRAEDAAGRHAIDESGSRTRAGGGRREATGSLKWRFCKQGKTRRRRRARSTPGLRRPAAGSRGPETRRDFACRCQPDLNVARRRARSGDDPAPPVYMRPFPENR